MYDIRSCLYKSLGFNRIKESEGAQRQGRRKALVVGFEHYGYLRVEGSSPYGPVSEKKSKNLPASKHDALSVATKLNSMKKEVRNFEVTLMIDQKEGEVHSLPGIEVIGKGDRCWCDIFPEQVEQLFHDSQPDDVLLFYFSGHGDKRKGDKKPCLVLPRYPEHTSEDDQFFFYPFEQLLSLIEKHTFKHCILILDCCYGGNVAKVLNEQFGRIKSGLTIITAGQEEKTVSPRSYPYEVGKTQADWAVTGRDPDVPTPLKGREGFPDPKQLAQKSSDREHQDVEVDYSFFTGYLIEALVGGAADPLGMVTTLSAYQFVSEAMGFNHRKYSEHKDPKERKSRPLLITNTDDAVVLRVLDTMLTNKDLHFLVKRFTNPAWLKAVLRNDFSIRKDKSLAVAEVTGHPLLEMTVRKLLMLGLIERKITNRSVIEYDHYRLTGRGKHYRDMVVNLYDPNNVE